MGTLIDTSVLIAAERGHLDRGAVLSVIAEEDGGLAMAAITASELLQGVHRLRGAGRAAADRSCRTWLSVLPVLPFDLDVARVHATLTTHLRGAGTPIAAHDLIIAATAVHHGYAVATRDRRSFHRVEGLEVEYW